MSIRNACQLSVYRLRYETLCRRSQNIECVLQWHLTKLVTLGGEPMPFPRRQWFEHRRCIQCDTRSRECVLTCVEPFPARSAYFHFDPEEHWLSSSDRLLCLRCCDKVKLCLCGRKDCSIPVVPYKKMYPEPYTKTTTASFLCTGQEPPKSPTQRPIYRHRECH